MAGSEGTPKVGGLSSLVGEVVCDCAGVVYSDELSEFPGSTAIVLSLLMVVFMTRRASNVEVKGSLSSSSPAWLMSRSSRGRASIRRAPL